MRISLGTTLIIGALVCIAFWASAIPAFAQNTNIISGSSYAVFSDLDMNNDGIPDRVNWRPAGQESVMIQEGSIDGFIWGETVGWINLDPDSSLMNPGELAAIGGEDAIGLSLTCSGTQGDFSGYLWGESTGWINMNPDMGGVNLLADGSFDGYAWSEIFGWIEFSCPGDACVRTTFTCDSQSPPGGPSGGGASTTSPPINPPDGDIDPDTDDEDLGDPDDPADPDEPGDSDDQDTEDTETVDDTDPHDEVIEIPAPGEVAPIEGCTDEMAINYNEQATQSDDSCVYDTPIINDTAPSQGPSTGLPVPMPIGIFQILAIIGAVSSIPGMLSRLSNFLLSFVGLWKKNKPWGTVYDARTKQPLDPAYVQLFNEAGEEIQGNITDADGRYGFIAPPGRYRIEAQKTHYHFPSERMKGKHKDELYDHLYFGEWFTIDEEGQVIAKNIPLDPEGDDWNEQEKLSMGKGIFNFFSKYDRLLIRVVNVLFVIGFMIAIYATIVAPGILNAIILGIYILLSILFIAGFAPAQSGRITYADGSPAAHVILRVFNAHLDKEVMHKVADEHGNYFILIHTGEYYVTIDRKINDDTYQTVFTSPSFKAKRGIINKHWVIDTQNHTS